MKMRNRVFSSLTATALLLSSFQVTAFAQETSTANTILINEIESSVPDKGNDWVEIINAGSADVDISGWFVADDKQLERFTEKKTTPVADGTILKAGEVLVLEENINFTFGLGREDTVCLYDQDQQLMDSYSYTAHAKDTYSRVIGSDTFVDQPATKGKINTPPATEETDKPTQPEQPDQPDQPAQTDETEGALVINEINSSPADYVELMNRSNKELDLSGVEIRDNSDDHRWQFPDNTKIGPGQLILVEDTTVGNCYNDATKGYESGEFQVAIGIGSGDSIRLYNRSGKLIDQYSWTAHASYEGKEDIASYGRYPDGTGSFVLMKETPGAANEWFAPKLAINEVESNGDDTDWVEVYNYGTTDIDLSGYYLLDNDPVGHATDVTPVAEGTVLKPGAYYVFDQNKDFTFGLGEEDSVTIFNKSGVEVAKFAYTTHAAGVYARIPDGTGDFVDFPTATRGKANVVTNPVVINEVQSNDPNKGPDWVELANPTTEDLDISGLVMKDDDDAHSYVIPDGTVIPANGFLVLDETQFGFGLGKNDSVRIFENDRLIQSTTWAGHTDPTWGLYPDVNGTEYRSTQVATPGAANKFADIPDVESWNGSNEVNDYDDNHTFLEDSSGLDFHNGQLYAVDNGTATFWILDVAADGTLTLADGFEHGKRVVYQKDANNPTAAGPDAEGITVDSEGFVYLATERDNSAKGVNYDKILKVDPRVSGDSIVTSQEWDITNLLPSVSANMGIEAVEWVANSDLDGLLFDQNTKAPFDHTNYPNATANGVFFTALEDNGHVYAFVLNNDSTATLIADIDSKMGGAMALDFDTYEHVLWVAADDGYKNRLAKLRFNGTEDVYITHVTPPTGLNAAYNYEGFAIADASFTVNGQRPVYRFRDGVTEGSLNIGSMACDYTTTDPENPGGQGGTGTTDPENPGDQSGTGTTDPENPGDQSGTDPTDPDDSETPDDQEETNKPNQQSGSNKANKATKTNQKNGSNRSSSPKTGDEANLSLWTTSVFVSLCALAVVSYKKLKDNRK